MPGSGRSRCARWPTKRRRATANGSKQRRAWVHASSGGRVGYLHLPDMMSAGFAEFHRYFRAECDRDGLIVDLRYNRGGHVSELLLEKLARRRLGYVHGALAAAVALPRRIARRPGGGADQRTCRLRRRHLQPRLQAAEARDPGRHAHLGRRHRHLAAAHPGRRQHDDPARVLLLVRGRGLGRREPRHRSAGRGRQRAAGRRQPAATASSRPRSPRCWRPSTATASAARPSRRGRCSRRRRCRRAEAKFQRRFNGAQAGR